MKSLSVSKTDYSSIAKTYDKYRKVENIWVTKVLEFTEIEKDDTVLDYGCGTGRYTLNIAETIDTTIIGLDPSIDMLKQAIEKDKRHKANWINADGQYLPFRDSMFNSVYMTLVIHHIEDKERAIHDIFRTIRSDGNCVIMTNSHKRIKQYFLRDFPGIIEKDLARFPSIPQIRRIMKKAGFQKTQFYPVQRLEYTPKEELIEKVKNKYISTLTLYSDEDFERHFSAFKKKAEEQYIEKILRHSGFDFVKGYK